MTDSPRIAGKRGVRRSPDTPELMLANFKPAPTTPPPSEGDVTNGITDWGMLGNDQYGDCGPAATMHGRMAKAGSVDVTPPITAESTEALYFAYGKSQGEDGEKPDEGVDNATWLKFLFEQGVIEAFARLDHKNVDEVHQAMLDFNGVLVGVELTDDAEQLFNDGQPWTIDHGETPDSQEGHDILLVKYDANGDTFVTWAKDQAAGVRWDAECIMDAWVFLTAEDAARTNTDIEALKAQIRAWGGSTKDPAPAPEPTPSDVPPAVEPQTFVVQINDIANGTGWAEIPVLPSIVTAVATSAAPGITAAAAPATDNPEETCITVTGVPAGISSLTVEVTFVEPPATA